LTLAEANKIVEQFQFEHDINTWISAFTRLSNRKKKTNEQAEAVAVIQADFDRILGA
jgi:hypothetical protein